MESKSYFSVISTANNYERLFTKYPLVSLDALSFMFEYELTETITGHAKYEDVLFKRLTDGKTYNQQDPLSCWCGIRTAKTVYILIAVDEEITNHIRQLPKQAPYVPKPRAPHAKTLLPLK